MNAQRSVIICLVGHVDAGKTTVASYLTGQSYDEFKGITQEIRFFKKNNVIIIDTPGHVDFVNDKDFALSISDHVFLIVDVNKGLMESERNFLKGNPQVNICWTKVDLHDKNVKESLKNLSFNLPNQLPDLYNYISMTVPTRDDIKAVVLGEIVHKGLGRGYEIVSFKDSTEENALRENQVDRSLHGNCSNFLKKESLEVTTFPSILNKDNTVQEYSPNLENNGEVILSLRCKN